MKVYENQASASRITHETQKESTQRRHPDRVVVRTRDHRHSRGSLPAFHCPRLRESEKVSDGWVICSED